MVQGVAEVLPVSSSAQLVLLPWLLGWEQPADRTAFAAGLHAGSCVGIAWALRRDLLALDGPTLLQLAASTVPAAVAGLVAADAVEQRLGRPPQLAALLAGAGALLWWADARAERRATPYTEPWTGAGRYGQGGPAFDGRLGATETAVAALAQVAALVPGVSRSGATLTALRLRGVDRAAARRFTLLMSLPITAGAAGLSLTRAGGAAVRTAAPGIVTAALAGASAVRLLERSGGQSVAVAALYRFGLAAVVVRRLSREGDR